MKKLLEAATPEHVKRAQRAIEMITAAHQAGSIYNVDYEEAKEAFKHILWRYGGNKETEWREFVPEYVHQIPGAIKNIQKLLKRPYISHYEVKKRPLEAALEVLREIEPIAVMMADLKSKRIMGRKPVEKLPPVRGDDTWTCAICGRWHKTLDNNKMVIHGYQRPGWGYVVEECFGYNHIPYEVSCEANQAYAPVLQRALDATREELARCEAGEIESLHYRGWDDEKDDIVEGDAKPGDERFPALLQEKTEELRRRIAGLLAEITSNTAKITSWTLQEPPGSNPRFNERR